MTQPAPETIDVRARTVKGFCLAYGVGRSTVYELIGAGKLLAVKAGARTLIIEESAREWLASLPTEKPSALIHKISIKRNADRGGNRRTDVDGAR